ncbi:hypothetical protein IWX46DRAFT_20802 [Phyllosticta citricarpa]|uniref:Secreted protein n=1 Tax=Phyllosticta citricarpa TaxID=55181 RepID=A0ABR1MQY9_9PEZI
MLCRIRTLITFACSLARSTNHALPCTMLLANSTEQIQLPPLRGTGRVPTGIGARIVSATLFASVRACVRAGCVTCHVRRQPLCTHTRAQPTWSRSFLFDIFAMPFVSTVCDLCAATTLVCKTA